MGKYKKSYIKIDLKYRLKHGMKNLIYLMDHILCQIFGYFKAHGETTDNTSIRIYINKTEHETKN